VVTVRFFALALLALTAAAGPHFPYRRAGANSGGPWLFPDYQRRILITIDSAQVDSTLTNFPVFIDYDLMPSTFHSNVQSDADDVRVSDSTHVAEYDIDNVVYDAGADDGEAWTCLPSISSSIDTGFYLYYDYASATAYSNPQDVWDATGSDFMGVWHLQAAGNATQDCATGDSDLDLTAVNLESGDSEAGITGSAVHYDGSNEYHQVEGTAVTSNLRPDTSFSMSAWINQDVTTSDDFIGGHLDSTTKGYGLWKYTSGSNFRPTIGNGSSTAWSNLNEPTSGKSTGVWYHIAVTWDGSTGKLYWDGAEADSHSVTGSFFWPGNDDFFLGKRPSHNYWAGLIDEVHVSDYTLSAAWIKAEEINQRTPGTFYTVGTEETQ